MSVAIVVPQVPKAILVEINGKKIEVIPARDVQGWMQKVNDTLQTIADAVP